MGSDGRASSGSAIEGATVYSADIKAGSSDEIELDVTDPAQWAALIAALPPLDVVMLNAGIITPGACARWTQAPCR